MWRHTRVIADYLEEECHDWEPNAFAAALEWLDMLPELLSTRPLRKWRMQFARELRDILSAEWGPDLALSLKTEVNLSDSQYQRLTSAYASHCANGLSTAAGKTGCGSKTTSLVRTCGSLNLSFHDTNGFRRGRAICRTVLAEVRANL